MKRAKRELRLPGLTGASRGFAIDPESQYSDPDAEHHGL